MHNKNVRVMPSLTIGFCLQLGTEQIKTLPEIKNSLLFPAICDKNNSQQY